MGRTTKKILGNPQSTVAIGHLGEPEKFKSGRKTLMSRTGDNDVFNRNPAAAAPSSTKSRNSGQIGKFTST